MTPPTIGFRTLTADGLRDLMNTHGEHRFELIDVREKDEYQERHIPGARWLPLSELEQTMDSIHGDKHTVFYCGSGKRSERAAAMVAEKLRLSGLYSLEGGLAAWDGDTLPHFPKLHVFDSARSLDEVVRQAMDLERGAEKLYAALVELFEGSAVRVSLERLLEAEAAHARLLHGALSQLSPTPIDTFETMYSSLAGDILESGESYEDVLAKAKATPEEKRWTVLELALDMEFAAYDLYRNLAARHHRRPLEDVLLKLAAQEKVHFRMVLDALGVLAAERRGS